MLINTVGFYERVFSRLWAEGGWFIGKGKFKKLMTEGEKHLYKKVKVQVKNYFKL
jgi:hypothetical protein